jgi:hypothetical protein
METAYSPKTSLSINKIHGVTTQKTTMLMITAKTSKFKTKSIHFVYILVDKVTVPHLAKKFSVFYAT